jgi:hypothetical protein
VYGAPDGLLLNPPSNSCFLALIFLMGRFLRSFSGSIKMRVLAAALLAAPALGYVVRTPVHMSAVQQPKAKTPSAGETSQDPLLLRAARGEVRRYYV